MIFIAGKKFRMRDGNIFINCLSMPEGISAILIVKKDKMTITGEKEIWQANRLKLEKMEI